MNGLRTIHYETHHGEGHAETGPRPWCYFAAFFGRPPFLPFSRPAVAFFADFARPPFRPNIAAAAAMMRSSGVGVTDITGVVCAWRLAFVKPGVYAVVCARPCY